MDAFEDDPPSGRRGGYLAATWIASVILILSALGCFFTTWFGITSAKIVYCEPGPAPVGERLAVVAISVVAWAALAGVAGFLLIRGRSGGAVVAVLLACAAFFVPFLEIAFSLFSAAMC